MANSVADPQGSPGPKGEKGQGGPDGFPVCNKFHSFLKSLDVINAGSNRTEGTSGTKGRNGEKVVCVCWVIVLHMATDLFSLCVGHGVHKYCHRHLLQQTPFLAQRNNECSFIARGQMVTLVPAGLKDHQELW